MIKFDFTDLIQEYSVDYVLINAGQGEYVDGYYQEGVESRESRSGAIVPFGENRIYQSGGSLTSDDRELYSITSLPFAEGTWIEHKGKKYKVDGESDYSNYTEAYVYRLKRVSAFD